MAWQVEQYRVSLRVDPSTKSLRGTEEIDVRSRSNGVGELAFSRTDMAVSEGTIDGRTVAIIAGANALTFRLPQPLRAGARSTLRLRFAGVPARGVTALPRGLYTSYFACDWMICRQDVPGDKAMLTLDLWLPSGLRSLAPGRLRATKRSGALELHRWRTERPYSPYLYAFAAGDFAVRRQHGDGGTFVYLAGTAEARQIGHLAAQTPAIASFLAQKAGLMLPRRRYTQLIVPGSEAQEAATFSLIGVAELEREQDQPGTDWIVVHEMAHQFWGNLVTCATWRDFWLNEGLATFMVAAWQETQGGRPAYARELERAARRVEKARTAGYDKPLSWSGTYPSLSVRRAIQYSKAALFFAALRNELGDAAFWSALRRYTRRHAGGVVTGRDLQRAMEKASGRDLTSLFERWVYGADAMS